MQVKEISPDLIEFIATTPLSKDLAKLVCASISGVSSCKIEAHTMLIRYNQLVTNVSLITKYVKAYMDFSPLVLTHLADIILEREEINLIEIDSEFRIENPNYFGNADANNPDIEIDDDTI